MAVPLCPAWERPGGGPVASESIHAGRLVDSSFRVFGVTTWMLVGPRMAGYGAWYSGIPGGLPEPTACPSTLADGNLHDLIYQNLRNNANIALCLWGGLRVSG